MLNICGDFADSVSLSKRHSDSFENKLKKNEHNKENRQKSTVLFSSSKTGYNFAETRKKWNNVDNIVRQPRSNRVSPKIPLKKVQSFPNEETKNALDSINSILQEISSIEEEVKHISKISTDNTKIQKIMTKFLLQLSDTKISSESIKKKSNLCNSCQNKFDGQFHTSIGYGENSKTSRKDKSCERQSSYIVLHPAGSASKTRANTKIHSKTLNVSNENKSVTKKSSGEISQGAHLKKIKFIPELDVIVDTKQVQTEYDKSDKESQYSFDDESVSPHIHHSNHKLSSYHSYITHKKLKGCYKWSTRKSLSSCPITRNVFVEYLLDYFRNKPYPARIPNCRSNYNNNSNETAVSKSLIETSCKTKECDEESLEVDGSYNKYIFRVLKIGLLQLHILVILLIILSAEVPIFSFLY